MSRTYKAQGTIGTVLTINTHPEFFNWTTAVTYYSDAFITPVTPTAGTVTVTGHIPGAGSNSAFHNSPIDATDLAAYASGGAPLDQVEFTAAGITGATHYSVAVTGTE